MGRYRWRWWRQPHQSGAESYVPPDSRASRGGEGPARGEVPLTPAPPQRVASASRFGILALGERVQDGNSVLRPCEDSYLFERVAHTGLFLPPPHQPDADASPKRLHRAEVAPPGSSCSPRVSVLSTQPVDSGHAAEERSCGQQPVPLDVSRLTTAAAAAVFASRGYERVARETAPEPIHGTTEFTGQCPATATCTRKRL